MTDGRLESHDKTLLERLLARKRHVMKGSSWALRAGLLHWCAAFVGHLEWDCRLAERRSSH